MPETLNVPFEEATMVVEDQVVDHLIFHREPAKTTDLIPVVNMAAVTVRVVRNILGRSSRFVSINHKWDLAVRHQAKDVPLERALGDILQAVGHPLQLQTLARELTVVLGRTPEYYVEMLPRFIQGRSQFMPLADGRVAWHEWILKFGVSEEDILFENFFMTPMEAELESFRSLAEEFHWDPENIGDSALTFISMLDRSISHLTLSFFAWKAAAGQFDPILFFMDLESRKGLALVSGCRWFPTHLKREFEKIYGELAQREEETQAEEEDIAHEEHWELDADDLDQVYRLVSGSNRSWRVAELVETTFDLTEGDRGYDVAVQQLNRLLVDDDRFLWVGTERWREANTLPEFVFDVPDQLVIQQYIFEDENHDPIDVELETKGIDEGLLRAMSDLFVQDCGDRDTDDPGTGKELDEFGVWVLLHHRETGTLPVLPAYRGLFPPAPDIIELMVTTNTGQRFPVWLNDTLETLYGFGQWYVEADLPMSGAVFTLSRTHVPGEYRLDYQKSIEPSLSIDDERMDELELVKLEAESESPLPTFDIIRRVMEKYGQSGAPFVKIWNEVNVIRRTTRRMLASILSAYQCFVAVSRGGDVWWYDEKRSPVINKQKRKYIRNIQ